MKVTIIATVPLAEDYGRPSCPKNEAIVFSREIELPFVPINEMILHGGGNCEIQGHDGWKVEVDLVEYNVKTGELTVRTPYDWRVFRNKGVRELALMSDIAPIVAEYLAAGWSRVE